MAKSYIILAGYSFILDGGEVRFGGDTISLEDDVAAMHSDMIRPFDGQAMVAQVTTIAESVAASAASQAAALASKNAAFTSAATATEQASIATDQAAAASASATTASQKSDAATASATAALASKNAAAASATSALASQNAAAASGMAASTSLATFKASSLGAFATEPTLDNAGNALSLGAWYFNTATNALYVYTGTGWQSNNAQIAALQQGQAGGTLGYTTLALLNADLAHPVNTLAIVTNDATAANNTTYIKVGASGAGSWQVCTTSPQAVLRVYIDSLLDETKQLYLFRNLMAFVFRAPNGKAAGGIAADGTLLAKLAVQGNGDISIVRSLATGWYTFALGVVRKITFQGGGLDATVTRYFNRLKALHLRTGANGALGDAITEDGYHRAKHAVFGGAGLSTSFNPKRGETTVSWGTAAEDRPLGGGNIVSTAVRRFFNREAVTHLLTGALGKAGLAVGSSGTVYIPKPYLPPIIAPGPIAISGGVAVRAEMRAGRYQLVKTAVAGDESVLASIGNNANPVIEGANVLYVSDRGTKFPALKADHYWQPLAGGSENRVFPLLSAVFAPGDSLSQGTYQPTLQGLLGVPVLARGIGGQNSTQIAMRQGALPINLTLSGNQIVSGVNTITAVNGTATGGAIGGATTPLFLSSGASNQQFDCFGWLMLTPSPVYGLVSRVGTNGPPSTVEVYTFTPYTSVALSIACPAGTLFVSEEAMIYADYVQSMWVGSNDVTLWPTDTDTTVNNISAMVARINPLRKKFVLMGPTINNSFPLGNTYHTGFNTVRSRLAALFPNNFVDIHNRLVTEGLTRAGITPTSGDITDMANDLVPQSLRADTIHLTATGYAVVAQIEYEFIHGKGWY